MWTLWKTPDRTLSRPGLELQPTLSLGGPRHRSYRGRSRNIHPRGPASRVFEGGRSSPDVLLERVRTEPIDVLSYMRDFERRTHVLVNEHRIAIGLQPLEYSEALATIARQHSQAIATGYEFFSHDGFEERERMAQGFVRLETFAENLALNNSSPASAPVDAVAGWLDSPGHRKNMEGQFNLTGIGCARGKDGMFYFTQLFGLR